MSKRVKIKSIFEKLIEEGRAEFINPKLIAEARQRITEEMKKVRKKYEK